MKRLFDFTLAVVALAFFLVPALLIALLIKLTSKGPIFHWSDRVGLNNQVFRMPKFRSMHKDTPLRATRDLNDPQSYVTPLGKILRWTSLDEIPQLYSILHGDMSFVGPRPVLPAEVDLIELRARRGINRIRPGLTGWAQINGRDRVTVEEKVALDEEYLKNQSFFFDIKILWRTFFIVIRADGISH